jgi:hypothetical protein
MDYAEFERLVENLGRRKDFESLRLIYNSDLPAGNFAAAVRASATDGQEVVEFCKGFEIDSPNWWSAFMALADHRRELVIGYVKEAAKSDKPRVRYYAYKVCQSAGWDDLVDVARKDLGNSVPVGFVPNSSDDEDRIGHVAANYIRAVGK